MPIKLFIYMYASKLNFVNKNHAIQIINYSLLFSNFFSLNKCLQIYKFMFTNVYKKKQLCEDNGKDQTTYRKNSKKFPCSYIPKC